MMNNDNENLELMEILQNQVSAQQVILRVLIRVMIEKKIISDKELTSKLEIALKYSENTNDSNQVEEIEEEEKQILDYPDEELLKYLQNYIGEVGVC